MRYRVIKVAITVMFCWQIASGVTAQSHNTLPAPRQQQIVLLNGYQAQLRVIDTVVYFIETYRDITPTYAWESKLQSTQLTNSRGDSFAEIVKRLLTATELSFSDFASSETVKDFIMEFTDSLRIRAHKSPLMRDLKLDLLYYYHHTWNLFNHARESDQDFDENLLAIYHLQRNHIGALIDHKRVQLHQQQLLDSLQTRVNSLVADIEKSKKIGFIRFDSLDSVSRRNERTLGQLRINQQRTTLIAPFFRKGKWLQKSQQLEPDTIKSLTAGKSYRKGKRALKKKLRKNS
jgi:hypothetical protein